MTISPGNSDSIHNIYLIAICGTGMTALAGMLKECGYDVTGSDQNVYPPMSTFLDKIGINVNIGYDEQHLEPPPDLVVVGNAMSRGNPEVEAVLEKKLNYISLPVALKEFFIRGKYSCVVTGTHGKTTTSSILAWVLESAGRDPGFFIGGIPENFGRGFKVGKGDHFVSEGDEYDSAFFDKGSKFLHYLPDLVILNNIEFDHADIFNNLDEIKISFSRMIRLIPRNGYLVSCWDDSVVRELSKQSYCNLVTFGANPEAEWRAEDIVADNQVTRFTVFHKSTLFGKFETPLHGQHMINNCLSVIASAHLLELSAEEISKGLKSFKNVRRRMQYLGEVKDVQIFDDFAHHPTEVKATIGSVRSKFPQKKIWAIFEPRTSTSKRKIFEDKYVEALSVADSVVMTPLFAQEKVPENERLSIENVREGLSRRGIPAWVVAADDEMANFLLEKVSPGDVLLFMSNGDFNQVPQKMLNSNK